jgi:WD40 repeat protein
MSGWALSPDGHTLVTTGFEKVAVWDLRTGKLVRQRSRDELTHRRPVFVSGGKEIVCEVLGDTHVLDLKTLKTRATLKPVGRETVDRFASSPDGALLACGSTETVTVWDVAKGKHLWHLDLEKEFDKEALYDVGGVAFSPDGKALGVAIAGLKSGDVVRLYDARTGRELRRFSGQVAEGVPRSPVFSPDGRWLAVAYNRKDHVEVWDVATGELIRGVRWDSKAGGSSAWPSAPTARRCSSPVRRVGCASTRPPTGGCGA